MQFIKDFGRNLLFFIVFGIAMLVIFPDIMRQVFQIYGALFGPLIIVILVVAALPRRQRSRR